MTVRKCDYCEKNSVSDKIIKTSRFGDVLLLCKTHYYRMVNSGKIERTYKCKNEIIEHNDYLEIILYDKKVNIVGSTKVSKQHRELVQKYKWGRKYYPNRYTDYVVATDKLSGKKVRLHVLIAEILYGKPPAGMTVDHINRDGLDNRDENIEYKDQTHQNYNQRLRKDNRSGVKGVAQNNKGYWLAQLKYKDLKLKKYYIDKDEAIKKRLYWEELIANNNIDLLRMEK